MLATRTARPVEMKNIPSRPDSPFSGRSLVDLPVRPGIADAVAVVAAAVVHDAAPVVAVDQGLGRLGVAAAIGAHEQAVLRGPREAAAVDLGCGPAGDPGGPVAVERLTRNERRRSDRLLARPLGDRLALAHVAVLVTRLRRQLVALRLGVGGVGSRHPAERDAVHLLRQGLEIGRGHERVAVDVLDLDHIGRRHRIGLSLSHAGRREREQSRDDDQHPLRYHSASLLVTLLCTSKSAQVSALSLRTQRECRGY